MTPKGMNRCEKCGKEFWCSEFRAHVEFCCAENTSVLPLLDLGQSPNEKIFQGRVMELCLHSGWEAFHDFDSRSNQAGFPDLIAVHLTTGVEFRAELKVRGGKVSKPQVVWLDAFSIQHSRDTFLWLPEDEPAIRAYAAQDYTKEALWAATRWVNRRSEYVK